MKILSINSFNIKLFSKFLSELSIGVHLKKVYDTKKFGSKVNNRQYFHMKNSVSTKITKKFTNKFVSKVVNRQYFHRKTGL